MAMRCICCDRRAVIICDCVPARCGSCRLCKRHCRCTVAVIDLDADMAEAAEKPTLFIDPPGDEAGGK